MKTAKATLRAIALCIAIVMLLNSPVIAPNVQGVQNKNSFYRKEYSKMYLDNCRYRNRIIYNDGNRSLGELTAKPSR